MNDGFLGMLAQAGFAVQHTWLPPFSEYHKTGCLLVTILKDQAEVMSVRQDFEQRGASSSIEKVYRKCCVDLGLYAKEPYGGVGADDSGVLATDLTIKVEGQGCHEQTIFVHPSFATISAHRYSGNVKHFMSPINTVGGVALTIHRAELYHNNDLGSEHVFDREVLTEVWMSSTQFAEMITTMNSHGTPCTLHYHDGILIGHCEMPSAEERLEENAKQSMDAAVAGMRALHDEIEAELSGPGALTVARKRELLDKMRHWLRDVDGKPQWLMRMFREHLDTAKVHAQSEFATWATLFADRTQDLWMQITGRPQPLALPDPNDPTNEGETDA